ncbi:HAD family phosphatase [Anaerolineae bacterium CFX9]|nr:HAD family phosphatase [Anaerolineae bacterium CFX9]
MTHTEQPPIQAVVLDLDGTLLNSKHELSPRNEAAVKAVIAKGIHVILATGKTRNSGKGLIEKLGIRSPGIYLQGLAVYDAEGKIIYQQTLDPALTRQVLTFMDDRGFFTIAYSGERILTRIHSQEAIDATIRYHEPAPEVIGALQNVVGELPLHKVMAIGDPRAILALRWQLGFQVGTQGRLMQAGVPTMLEVLPPGGGKGSALRWLLKELRISPERVMAVGDAENDVEMIKLAGIGVAMAQAAQNVRDAADHVVGSNDEDGVAEALERFVLAPQPEQPTPAISEVKPS